MTTTTSLAPASTTTSTAPSAPMTTPPPTVPPAAEPPARVPAATTTTAPAPPANNPPPAPEANAPDRAPVIPEPPPAGGAVSPVIVPRGPGTGSPLPEGSPPGSTDAAPLPPAGGDDSTAPTSESGLFPADLRALRDSVVRTGANNSQRLIEALAPLGQYGLSPEEAAVVGFGRFPVAGKATYSHDWWFPRFGPGWRLHEGTDIFAARGTPVRAPAAGMARIRNGALGGLSVYVIEPDGTYYYLAHLAGTAPDLIDGAPVRAGQVVGFVGDSGNARGGSPHVHFEVHPGGGGPVDPKPVLDQFLTDALVGAPAVVDAYARASVATGLTDQPPSLPEPRAARLPLAGASRSALLWASAASPTGGALRLAEAEAVRAAADIQREPRLQAQAVAQQETEAQLRAWMAPLVPPALASVID